MAWPLSRLVKDQSLNSHLPIYVCDIEAHKWIDFKVIGSYDGTNFKSFLTLDDYFHFMVEDGQDKQVFAHFGGIYDFMFLLKNITLETSLDLEVTSIIPRGSGVLCFDVVYTNRYKNKQEKEIVERVKLRFNDSSALLPFGLESLTKSFNVEHKKKKFNFETWDGSVTDELLGYLKDDCRGLYEVIHKFYDWPLIKYAGRGTTMASQALRVYRTFMTDDIPTLPKNIDNFTRKAYFGGRTEIFKPYFSSAKETLKTFDVNSLYPSVMIDRDYPTEFDERVFTYNPKKLGVWHVDVDVPEMYIPPLGSIVKVPSKYEYYLKRGVKKTKIYESDKFAFCTGKFSGYFTTPELEYARSLGVKIKKIHGGVTFKNGGKIFSRYIETLYKMRLKAQRDGDFVTDIMCKFLMNALYGRFGMNPVKEGLSFDSNVFSDIYLELKGKNKTVPIYKGSTVLNSFFNVAIPTYVTSYSRIAMHEHYMKCGENIWYTDTDSLFTTHNFKDSNNLGGLKLEYESKRACFLLPKTYAAEKISDKGDDVIKKVAMKGFDKKLAQKFTLDDFRHALEGELHVLRVNQPAKMARFKTALRKNDYLLMMNEHERGVKSTYDKRRIIKSGGNYDSEPLHVRDGKVIN